MVLESDYAAGYLTKIIIRSRSFSFLKGNEVGGPGLEFKDVFSGFGARKFGKRSQQTVMKWWVQFQLVGWVLLVLKTTLTFKTTLKVSDNLQAISTLYKLIYFLYKISIENNSKNSTCLRKCKKRV